MIKIDLHTHSIASYDGGLSEFDYRTAIKTKRLDVIAVTDHNTIDFARSLHKVMSKNIIIGEEIMTLEGEVIGLYLQEAIPSKLSLEETVQAIKAQRGVVYIPHPFETLRKGLSRKSLSKIIKDVELLETHNGRAFAQNKAIEAIRYAHEHQIIGCASSDAHGKRGWGRTYTMIDQTPSPATIVNLLKSGKTTYKRPSPLALAYPKYHKIRKKLS